MTIHLDLEAPSPLHRVAQRATDPSGDTIASHVYDASAQTLRSGWTRAPFRPAWAGAQHRYAIASTAGSEVLRRAISGLDGYLTYCCGVKPFASDERCLLRYATIPSPGDFRLTDGTGLKRGDLVIDLHLWNEHIPPVPKRGPDLAWARLVAQSMKHSLTLLSDAVEANPDLRGARAIRARTNFVGWGGQSESMSRLIGRFGFEDVDEGTASMPERVHDAFENILIGALTWTHNPEALRRDKLIRQRRPVWMSVDVLRRRQAGCRGGG